MEMGRGIMKKKGLSLFLALSLIASSFSVYGEELSDGSGEVYVETEPQSENVFPEEESLSNDAGFAENEDILSDGNMESSEEVLPVLEDEKKLQGLSDGVNISELTGESTDMAEERAAVSYTFDEVTGILTISGQGRMPDYNGDAPWNSYKDRAEKIVVNEGITYIGTTAFWEFDSADTAVLPSTLKEIGTAAFGNCSSLAALNLPEGLEKIKEYAFQDTWIQSIELPSTLRELSPLFAWGCYAQTVSVASGNPRFASRDGVLFTKDMKKLLYYPRKRPAESYVIPESVQTIGENAFIKAAVRQVVIPYGVTKLESGCFSGSWIKSLAIPDSVKETGDYICEECIELVSLQIGNGLKELGNRAFYGCISLKDVKLGNGLVSLSPLSFAYTSIKQIAIPEGVKYIENGAFGESALETVYFPTTLKEIWYQSFLNCSNLTSVTFPEGLEKINRLAFHGTGITKVKIPDSLTFLGAEAFSAGTEIIYSGDMDTNEDGSMQMSYELPLKVTYDYASAFKVLELTNKERKNEGLALLTMDKELLDAAMKRAAETAFYFSHTRPNGSDCFSVSGKMSGENIGAGYSNAEWAVIGWMNSPGHRGNILNLDYTSIGVGAVVVNGVRYWVQAFGSVKPEAVGSSQYKNRTETTTIKFCPNENSEEDSFSFTAKGDASLGVVETKKAEFFIDNTFVYVPVDAGYVTFESDNPSVCKVAGNQYTGTGAGKTKIKGSLKSCPKVSASFEVAVSARKIPVSELKIKLSPSEFTYNGGERKPEVIIFDKSGNVISKSNFIVDYPSSSKYPGTYTLKIIMKGNYSGSTTKTYTIKKANQKVFVFDRKDESTPLSCVTKRLDSKTLTLGAKVVQGNKTGKILFRCDNPAVATVTAWGKITFHGVGVARITAYMKGNGNYNSASHTVTLTVIPNPTAITKLQSQKPNWLNIQYRANRKADGYQIQYGTSPDMKGAKYAAVKNSAIRSYTRKDVKSGVTYYVRVRTFKVVNGTRYYSNWSGIKSYVTK